MYNLVALLSIIILLIYIIKDFKYIIFYEGIRFIMIALTLLNYIGIYIFYISSQHGHFFFRFILARE